MFEITFVFVNKDKGAKHIVIDPARLPYFLNLNQSDIEALKSAELLQSSASVVVQKSRINYSELAAQYKQKFDNGEFPNRAALARNIGVSRA